MSNSYERTVWRIRKDSLYLRFFIWLWSADPKNLDVCKLFWGTLFAPLALFRWKEEVGVIPRIAITSGVLGFVFLAFSVMPITTFLLAFLAVMVAFMSAFGAVIAFFVERSVRRERETEHKKTTRQSALNRISGTASWVAGSMIHHRITKALYRVASFPFRFTWGLLKVFIGIPLLLIWVLFRFLWDFVPTGPIKRFFGMDVSPFFRWIFTPLRFVARFVGAYLHALKERYCPIVYVVDPNPLASSW